MPIILKDKDSNNVVYTQSDRQGNLATFRGPGNLLGRPKLTIQVQERANTNRIVGKLSVPTVRDCTDQCKAPEVAYTEVGSFDLSSVLIADAVVAKDFLAQFVSLVSSDAVRDAFLSGTVPA